MVDKADIIIGKKNELYLEIECSQEIKFILYDYYSFSVDGHKFMPKYKSGSWDGRIRLFSATGGRLYHGLFDHLTKFLDQSGYTWEVKDQEHRVDEKSTLSPKDINDYIATLKYPFELHDYQINTICECITNHRKLILSSTSSGKTASLFALANYYKDFGKVLILFPTTALVMQTRIEFISYGMDAGDIHEIFEDRSKDTDKSVILATWQGLYTQPQSYFRQFTCVIVDEVHSAVAKSLTSILEKLDHCKYRFGFTGTLDGIKTNELILMGLFGDCKQMTTTKQLIENKQISDVKIKMLVLKHPYKMFNTYSDEIEYLVNSDSRNKVIKKLVGKIEGNTLILFNRVAEHAIPMHKQLIEEYPDKNIHLVYGKVKTDIREEIRQVVETQDNAVICASYQTFQQGINIKNLHNIIFASPSKSRIRNLQSLGRGLRLHKSKKYCVLYDIGDNISNGNHKNYTFDHMLRRIQYYAAEDLNFETIELNLN